jgi:hypothetical protein
MKVAEVLDHFPQALSLFLESGFQFLANSPARKTFAKVVSIEKACEKHGVNMTKFLAKLNRTNFKTKAPYFFASSGVVNFHYLSEDLLGRGLVLFCVLPMLL